MFRDKQKTQNTKHKKLWQNQTSNGSVSSIGQMVVGVVLMRGCPLQSPTWVGNLSRVTCIGLRITF